MPACRKETIPVNAGSEITCQKVTNENIRLLNAFHPNSNEIVSIYKAFRNEVKVNKQGLKSNFTPSDRLIDEAIWAMEAAINAEHGFKQDSIEYLVIDTTKIIIKNKHFNDKGVPIIDGFDLMETYNRIESQILANHNVRYLFWASRIEIAEITQSVTVVDVINAGGPKSITLGAVITPLPPGSYIPPFTTGTSSFAGSPQYYMAGAERLFWDKIRMPGYFFLSPDYIATYYYSTFISAYHLGYPQIENRLLWSIGTCESFQMNTSQLNQYLYSSKEVIDEYNPINNPNLMIGYFQFNCWEVYSPTLIPYPGGVTIGHWFNHAITFAYYRVYFVGQPV